MSTKRLILAVTGILMLLSFGATLEAQANTPGDNTPGGTTPSPTYTITRTSTPTPTQPLPCDPTSDYVAIATTGASIVPGTTDIGNHCIDCMTNLGLPFPVHLYDQTFTSVNVSTHGNLQFVSNSIVYDNVCLPYPGFDYSIMPHWDDIRTDCSGCGIYTAVSGAVPNRILNIEWRTQYLISGGSANFEVRFYESGNSFDIIYGTVSQSGAGATIGVQKGSGIQYTQYSCNLINILQPGLQLTFRQYLCNEQTFTPTFTRTSTSTPTSTFTPTSTPTGPTFTATRTPTPTSTGIAPPVDMYGSAVWLTPGPCPDPTLQLITSFFSLASSDAPSLPPATPICNIGSTHMLLQNSRGERIDFAVPPLSCFNRPYTYNCPVGPCLPSSWLDALPFTLTVNYRREVNERNFGNNSSVLSSSPPPGTPCPTYTPTMTPTAPSMLVGHITWQGPPPQPSALQQLPVTFTLKLGANEINYPNWHTDAGGFFTVSVNSLASGTYSWRAKGSKYLANTGTVTLTGASLTSLDIGLMLTGDCNDDNVVNATDFNIVRLAFGKGIGDPGYDDRADLNGDNAINVGDFNLLKANFGRGGSPPISPGNGK